MKEPVEDELVLAAPGDLFTSSTSSSPPAQPPDVSDKSSYQNVADESTGNKKPRAKRSSSSRSFERPHTLIPEFDSPLARSFGVHKTWTYTICLTLEDLFKGKKLRFRVVRCKINGKRKSILLNVNIPPGSAHGTQIIFKETGHERKDGSREDIHFILEEEKHEKFVRVNNDLVVDARLPWVERLRKEKGVVFVKGLDGREARFEVDFAGEGNVTGMERIEGAGMPVPGTEKRGVLVVR
jgi:DnaJ family protein B protein 4